MIKVSFLQKYKYVTKSKGYNDHLKETALILKQILSTNSLRKCMEISLENLYVDIGIKGVN